jgi:transcriptional regulator with XRE-family HTH domain
VASLAGVSIGYYTKLERGDASGVSDTVLEALTRALQLSDAERIHLFDLARAQQPVPRSRRRRTGTQTIRPGVQRVLDRIDAPAFVRNGRMDVLAMNRLGEALYSEMLINPRRPVNSARFCFLDSRATTFYSDWEESADASVAVLRAEAGRNPYDPDLTNLIGELSTQSEGFRIRWARHDVGSHDAGLKRLHHPIVGQLELTYEGMTLAARPRSRSLRIHCRGRLEVRRGSSFARQLGIECQARRGRVDCAQRRIMRPWMRVLKVV